MPQKIKPLPKTPPTSSPPAKTKPDPPGHDVFVGIDKSVAPPSETLAEALRKKYPTVAEQITKKVKIKSYTLPPSDYKEPLASMKEAPFAFDENVEEEKAKKKEAEALAKSAKKEDEYEETAKKVGEVLGANGKVFTHTIIDEYKLTPAQQKTFKAIAEEKSAKFQEATAPVKPPPSIQKEAEEKVAKMVHPTNPFHQVLKGMEDGINKLEKLNLTPKPKIPKGPPTEAAKKARSEAANAWQKRTISNAGHPIVTKDQLRGNTGLYILRLLVKENPKTGTAGWRFAQYKDGAHVLIIQQMASPGLRPTLQDLIWDQLHDFIRLEEVK